MPIKSAIVLGASSMLGREIVRQLSASKIIVISAGRQPNNDIVVDLGSDIPPAFDANLNADVLFHCASAFGGGGFHGLQSNLRVNVNGCAQVLDIAQRAAVRKVAFSGSLSSYPEGKSNVLNGYGFSKAQAEQLLTWGTGRLGCGFCSIRLTQLWDTQGDCCKHQAWLGRIIAYASRGLELRMPTSMGPRNFMHVSDAARLLILAAESNLQGVHPGCSPVDIELLKLATLACKIFNCGGTVTIDQSKVPFRKVDYPKDASVFSTLGYSPAIHPDQIPSTIYDAGTASKFGPVDVI